MKITFKATTKPTLEAKNNCLALQVVTRLISSLAILAASPGMTYAFHLPLWEFGAGLGAINAPHYRGSKTVEQIYLPFPYITYRGESFKIDREGIRSKLFDSNRMRLDISVAGNIPVPKTDDSARAGMPGLDPVGEIGPVLEVSLWQDTNAEQSWWLKFPYRFVFSVGSPLMEYHGWSFSPYLDYKYYWRNPRSLVKLNFSLGPIFADNKYHDYFYKVEQRYVTPERHEYDADAGYSGSRVTITLSKTTEQYYLGAFARYDDLSGATFEDSPLVETRNYFIFGFAFAWIFTSSEETVPHRH